MDAPPPPRVRRPTGLDVLPVAPGQPRVRARHLKTLLEAIDQHAAGERVRRAIGPEPCDRIAGASAVDWLPAELDALVSESIAHTLSPRQAPPFFHDLALLSFDRPLLRPIATAAVALFGLDVGSLARQVPRAWGQIFAACGTVTVDAAEGGGLVLRFEDLPLAFVRRGDVWLQCFAWSARALFTVTRQAGKVAVVACQPARRRGELHLTW